ncbi:AzlC family ABC transporter permease [Alicyclobacillus herbarius]|uniref:AzlC family ABC transporter permease n=1 Tax=Alicyclobacillus herbarius TaxID=122960 RepID=UPI000401C960|nr:AzlC family ABC transporter permease [Alicyclobacillus herbarius]
MARGAVPTYSGYRDRLVVVGQQVAAGVRDGVPIIVAYFPVAVTFGVVCSASGLPRLLGFLISVLVYAGGAQFMLVSLAVAGVPWLPATATVLLVNLRHFLYGAALGPSLNRWPERWRLIAAFGLTDEVFAMASGRIRSEIPTPPRHLALTFACYASWLAGTAVGLEVGAIVPSPVADVLGFALPALFLALILLGERTPAHLLAALFGALAAVAATHLHLGSFAVLLGAGVGALAGCLISVWQETRSRAPTLTESHTTLESQPNAESQH